MSKKTELIGRQAVLDQIELWARYDVPDVEAPMDLVGRILELPSAEPKTGRWIDHEIPLESGGAMPIQVCNLCSTFYPLAHTGGGYHFCPNCGADMRGEE